MAVYSELRKAIRILASSAPWKREWTEIIEECVEEVWPEGVGDIWVWYGYPEIPLWFKASTEECSGRLRLSRKEELPDEGVGWTYFGNIENPGNREDLLEELTKISASLPILRKGDWQVDDAGFDT